MSTRLGKLQAELLAMTLVLLLPGHPAVAALILDGGTLVHADGVTIQVPGYSVPSYVDWNSDGLSDLIVGEGSGAYTPKVRVYLNVATADNPQFSSFAYAQSSAGDLTCPGSGCLGLFPRVVQWDGDGKKDLLVGQSDGKIKLFLNTATDAAPVFDAGTFLQVGNPDFKVDIDVGYRATSIAVDWNNDGRKDLVSGALDGKLHLFLNEGTDTAPDFLAETIVQADGSDLVIPSGRSSPVVLDLCDDGKKDLLSGNTDGQLVFCPNVGTDAAPEFSGYSLVEGDGEIIDLPGTPRSRPFVCDWTGDGLLDVLLGAGDGQIHLYQGVPEPATWTLLALGGLALLRRR